MPLAGQFVRASDLPNRVGCRLRRAANQSINSATTTSISWDTEDEDTDGFIAVTASTVTIPTGLGGLYAITANCDFQGTITGAAASVSIAPTSGITGYPVDLVSYIDASTNDRGVIGVVIPLLAGDTFVVQCRHVTGSAQNIKAWMSCYRIGA
jgi:hypothetical protein